MKILYIASRGFDYVQDLMFDGLTKTLGKSSLIDTPWNPKFHLPLWKYPKNLGFQSGSLLRSFLNRFERNFDVVIVAACKKDAFESYLKIQNHIPRETPIIFFDGGDADEVGVDLEREGAYSLFLQAENNRPFDIIFKREFLYSKTYESRVKSLPMCINTSIYDSFSRRIDRAKKIYDVTFWAVESAPVRSRALELIQDKFDCRGNGSIRGQTFKNYSRKGSTYLANLSQSRIVLNFRGVGWDTLRYWEVPALGAFLMSQKPQILIENPFVNEKSIVYVADDLSDLVEKCDFYLKNERVRERIAATARAHALSFHRSTDRAETILRAIERHRHNVRIPSHGPPS